MGVVSFSQNYRLPGLGLKLPIDTVRFRLHLGYQVMIFFYMRPAGRGQLLTNQYFRLTLDFVSFYARIGLRKV